MRCYRQLCLSLIATAGLPLLADPPPQLPANVQRVHVAGAGPAGIPVVVRDGAGGSGAQPGNAPAGSSAFPATGSTATPPGHAKKAPLAPSGVWKWTTYNRSMQPEENTITLSVDKNGKVSGTLVDRLGQHPVKNVTLGDGAVSFDVMYHTRGAGDFPHTFTVSLDPDQPAVSIERPDLTPAGRAAGGKRHEDHKAKHDPAG